MTNPHATNEDIVAALVETFRESRSMLFPNAGRLVWRRLVDAYGEKVVERAPRVRLREASREQRAMQREARSLKRQLKRQAERL